MAKLILTEKEKADKSYLDWDDESIGKATKRLGVKFQDEYGKKALWSQMAAQLLISETRDNNAEEMELFLQGMTSKGEPIGDWKVTIKKVK